MPSAHQNSPVTMLNQIKSFVDCNPVTPVLILLMTVVLLLQLVIVSRSEALFEFLFVGQAELTLGVLLAPLSHGSIWTHFGPNMLLFVFCGWPTEDALNSSSFLLFTIIAAYLPTYLQIGYSTVTTGTAGTVGFSGAVFALPPVLLCLRLRDNHYSDIGTAGYFALGITAGIPLVISGHLEFLSTLPSADVTHTMGYVLGWGYGLLHLKQGSE